MIERNDHLQNIIITSVSPSLKSSAKGSYFRIVDEILKWKSGTIMLYKMVLNPKV